MDIVKCEIFVIRKFERKGMPKGFYFLHIAKAYFRETQLDVFEILVLK